MKQGIENPEENKVIFLNVHEAIVDRETWEKVQKLISGTGSFGRNPPPDPVRQRIRG